MKGQKMLKRLFTWWNGQTLRTQLYTLRHGCPVGSDDQGNIYYETRDKKRRWVIYNGLCEASRIPSDWHGWLHHTFKDPPNMVPLDKKSWEKAHQANLTGSDAAYRPAGSLHHPNPTPVNSYDAWKPE